MDDAASAVLQTLSGVDCMGHGSRCQHWQHGLKLLEDVVPGDVLAKVARDDVLLASSRQELILAIMEAMHDSKPANCSVRHTQWVRAASQSSGRLAIKLLAGCGSGTVLDALSGEAPSPTRACGDTLQALRCFASCCPAVADNVLRTACAGTAVEQALEDEVQALQHEYAAYCGALSEPQHTRLAAVFNASKQQMELETSASASRIIATYARASAVVDKCAIPGPGPSELCIAPGGLGVMPEVASARGVLEAFRSSS